MKILSIKAVNFRSYQKIDWTLPSEGLFLIDGTNLETGRANMVGKTTLLDSIAWALYGYLPKWGGPKGGPADAVIKRGEDKCSVTVTLQNSSDLYEITRQRPVKLTVKKNGIVQEGKTSDLDKRYILFDPMNTVDSLDPEFFIIAVVPIPIPKDSFGSK